MKSKGIKRRIQIVKNVSPIDSDQLNDMVSRDTRKPYLAEMQQGENKQQIDNDDPEQVEIEFDSDKWRPFYYDMFNRVGNLTILSLSKKRNALIEAYHENTELNIHCNYKLSRKPMKNLEKFTDYSSLRIYWKYDKNHSQSGPPKSKGFFLVKGDSITEVNRTD